MNTSPLYRFVLLVGILLPGTALAQSSDYLALLETRVQQLEAQVAQLTGQVQEANFRANQSAAQLQRVQEDIDTRFRMLNSAGASAPTEPAIITEPQPVVPSDDASVDAQDEKVLGQLTTTADGTPTSGDAVDDPGAAYDTAFALLRDGDYEAAEVALKAFLQKWPKHELSSNASYWVGETYYVRGDFAQAAKSFAESYKKYPKGAKGEDTLVKLGLSLSALGRTKDACLTLGQVGQQFPSASASNKRRIEQERDQLGCDKPVAAKPAKPAKAP